MKTRHFRRIPFIQVMLRNETSTLLPPLPPGEGWGEGEGRETFIS
jgi:hypothetical protein